MKTNYAVIVLAVLLVLAVGYIGFDKWQDARIAREDNIYKVGMQRGYEQAIVQLLSEAVKCQPVPVTYNNASINMVAVECLNQQ